MKALNTIIIKLTKSIMNHDATSEVAAKEAALKQIIELCQAELDAQSAATTAALKKEFAKLREREAAAPESEVVVEAVAVVEAEAEPDAKLEAIKAICIGVKKCQKQMVAMYKAGHPGLVPYINKVLDRMRLAYHETVKDSEQAAWFRKQGADIRSFKSKVMR